MSNLAQIDIKNYSKVIVNYGCNECNLYDYFDEKLEEQSSMKSVSCMHYEIKFLYNLKGNIFKYFVSFNCLKCSKNNIITIFDEKSTSDTIEKTYKCDNCKNSSILFSLEKKIISGRDNNNYNNQMNNGVFQNQNNLLLLNNFGGNNMNENNGMYQIIIKDMTGAIQDTIWVSPNDILGKILREYFKSHPNIDRDRVRGITCNGKSPKLQCTIKGNELKDKDQILIVLR